jgi:protein-S-isoprenylcysteine O-methyltransferase Ste14
MYVAATVTLMLAGWSVAFGSPVLATYTASVLVGFHLRILFGEESWLGRTHGAQWEEYRARVPRWSIRHAPGRAHRARIALVSPTSL